MIRRFLTAFLFLAGGTLLWAAEPKDNLDEARKQYKESVKDHGADSPEAHEAREHLRSTRRDFHAQHHSRTKDDSHPTNAQSTDK